LRENTWGCEHNHRFDRAKEGYVNLLLAQHKNSKNPGDNTEMVQARQAFLATQSYLPLAQKLAQISQAHMNLQVPVDTQTLFDVGCSEGYYSAYIQRQLLPTTAILDVAGLDISKPAVQKAAKANKQNAYAVASSYDMPVADNSVDIALQVFAPASADEVSRILKNRGTWLRVSPAANHLQELKAFVYESVQSHTVKNEIPNGFVLLNQYSLSFQIELQTASDRLNLLKMTPFYWRISADNKDKLLSGLRSVTADFVIQQLSVTA
jgi:23S rRNA (guanine745-N1)-methyltransferase